MEPARQELATAIQEAKFEHPICPIYQNVNASPQSDRDAIKQNLVDQLTAPVKWTQTMRNLMTDGMTEYIEVGGTGKVLQGFIKRLDRRFPSSSV